MSIAEQINAIVSAKSFGAATARKAGRNPQFPYVPIVDHGTHTEQLRGLAYAKREDAVAKAQAAINARRELLREQLQQPRYRALREQHGLPRDL